jgi:hypothetical protein
MKNQNKKEATKSTPASQGPANTKSKSKTEPTRNAPASNVPTGKVNAPAQAKPSSKSKKC